jgi:hypothetical protein
LIEFALKLMSQVHSEPITAFRAGSFSSNQDTFRALSHVGMPFDSSIHALLDCSAVGMRASHDVLRVQNINGVRVFPLTMFRDGIGRTRPAQIGACSYSEFRDALESAQQNGNENFVILSHNFEMLKQGQSVPDPTVVSRFRNLCEYLGRNRETLETSGFCASPNTDSQSGIATLPNAKLKNTLIRYAEQALRRVAG